MQTSWSFQCLVIVLSCFSLNAAAATVQLTNGARRPLCIAVGINRSVDFRVTVEMSGWTCFNNGESFSVTLDGDRTVAIREASGENYLVGSRAARYPAADFYVPSAVVDEFGLVIATVDEGFSYKYHIGPGPWSDARTVSDFADLETLLATRGFVPVNGWTYSASLYPGGLGLLLNE